MKQTENDNNNKLHNAAGLAHSLGTSKRCVLEAVKRGRIPCVRINDRVLRFHLPTVLEALSK